MTTKLLLIETDETHKVEVSQQEAPALFEAWDAWIGAEQGSSREAHLWNRVLEEAGVYVDDNTTFDGEIIEDVRGVD